MTGIWNIFAKLGLPVVALALLVVTGHSYPALIAAAAVGVVVLVVAVVLLVLVFRSEAMARKVGHGDRLVARARSEALRQDNRDDLGDKAVKFRRETIVLARRRWFMLTWTTLLSQLALCFVLVLSLRHMGVSEQELPFVEIFAVYSFSRLLSAVPITPGGVGVIDLGYIAGSHRVRQHREGPDRRRRADLPRPHVRDPDPARGGDVRDLAPHEAVVPGRTATGFDRGGARGRRGRGSGGAGRPISVRGDGPAASRDAARHFP